MIIYIAKTKKTRFCEIIWISSDHVSVSKLCIQVLEFLTNSKRANGNNWAASVIYQKKSQNKTKAKRLHDSYK